MHVVVAFSPNYGSTNDPELGDAFWLVESPANRAVAQQRWQAQSTDPNSALFQGASTADVEGMMETVEVHHPNWSRIDFIDAALTDGLKRAFLSEGFQISDLPSGFTVIRKVR